MFDALYTMDGVNRLLRAKEGHWDGSTVTDGNAKRDEVWTLEQTGNWEFFKRDLDGDLDYTDTNELKDRRTHNVVNELLTRDTDDNSSANYAFTYDDNGNMTDDGQRYTYKWDAFGRLKEVRNRSNSALVAEYKYNGLGYRIGWHYDTDADGTVESNTDDPWYLFVYDERWRILNTYRLLDWAYNASNPAASYAKERFVYHNAGLGGWGGSSYIDSVMLRDRDAATAWNAASDGTMEERVYYAQNWRHDVSAIITSAGQMVEWVKYSSYGVPWSMPAADTDSDGDFDATDASAITGTYDVRKDVNLDGTVDVVDFLEALDLNNGYVNQGWSKLGLTKWGNRKGYAGYEGDTALAGTKWHVRHRVLESELGRWMRRDPAGYVDGPNLHELISGNPLTLLDATGLMSSCQTTWFNFMTFGREHDFACGLALRDNLRICCSIGDPAANMLCMLSAAMAYTNCSTPAAPPPPPPAPGNPLVNNPPGVDFRPPPPCYADCSTEPDMEACAACCYNTCPTADKASCEGNCTNKTKWMPPNLLRPDPMDLGPDIMAPPSLPTPK